MRLAGWFWLLSGLPFAAALVAAWMYAPPVAVALFAVAIILEQGHVLSPLVLTGTHPSLRRVALSRWPEFLLVPFLIMIAVFVLPLPWVFGLYWSWNIWHFGMQNFGVVALHHRSMSPDGRARTALLCVGSTAAAMGILPFIMPFNAVEMLMVTGMLSFQHWIVDIGLSSRVSRNQLLFIVAMLAMGCIGFIWKRPFVDHIGALPVSVVPHIHLARWGVGIVHFWISARIWKDPQVKAAFTSR